MPSFTKKAIKDAFVKLLSERPINKISVKDIVEECGINRNSFYYHFQDVPTLIEEIVMEHADNIIADYSPNDPVEVCIKSVMDFASKHRRETLHIYRYVDREVFESYLWKICERIITVYVDNYFANPRLSPDMRSMIIHILKCESFGLVIAWMNDGMPITNDESISTACAFGMGLRADSFRKEDDPDLLM